ncbi:hypothetical protein NPIL_429371 [Nephila pilipes]|uniref:Uncharacterized protein n=1 Tax=Nephila pilipes TaxID=299642 RepID=A0A8X6Q5X4_NEPPI|nr:hypothetical protein NPIL_429371 [Nephila pilipes]
MKCPKTYNSETGIHIICLTPWMSCNGLEMKAHGFDDKPKTSPEGSFPEDHGKEADTSEAGLTIEPDIPDYRTRVHRNADNSSSNVNPGPEKLL